MTAIVIVITGTPGSGKTSIAEEVSKKGYASYSLAEFAVENDCVIGFDKTRDSNIVDVDKLEDELEKYLATQEGIILLEGHYGDVVPAHLVNRCFVLNTPPDILRERLGTRGYNEKKIEENVVAELMQVCYIDAVDAYGVDKITKIDNMPIATIKELLLTYIFLLENTK